MNENEEIVNQFIKTLRKSPRHEGVLNPWWEVDVASAGRSGWNEVSHKELTSQRYTIANIFRRLSQKDDPWKGIGRHASPLQKKMEHLPKH